eukprot:scaffold6794_cov46-Attheya_sp.AAC.6
MHPTSIACVALCDWENKGSKVCEAYNNKIEMQLAQDIYDSALLLDCKRRIVRTYARKYTFSLQQVVSTID